MSKLFVVSRSTNTFGQTCNVTLCMTV